MTTNPEIKLPPLPSAAFPSVLIRRIPRYLFTADQMQDYARAAVEADRQDQICGVTKMVPSDDELLALSNECEKMPGGLGMHYANYGRALLSRYGSSQPVQPESRRDTLLHVIQTLNSNPYSLTKSECIDVVRGMFDEADKGAQPAASAEPVANDIEDLIERVLDAQQDINLEANIRMSQTLCDAAALLDDVETALRRYTAPVAARAAKGE